MSYFQNINPKAALETLGFRQEQPSVLAEVVLPSIAIFALGACVGAGAALLLAPKSGRELRHDLSVKAGEIKTQVRNALPVKNAENGVGMEQMATSSYERPEFG
jgi:hypothetical protein